MGKSGLKESLCSLREKAKEGKVSVQKIFHTLSGRGKAFILILLAIPFCQPFQIPGSSSLFGLLVAMIGLRMAFGKRIWLPQKILKKEIDSRKIEKIIERVLHWIKKMKPWIHSRLTWMCYPPAMKVINGIAIFLLGLFLALPLPIPFSNLSAAWAIFLMALGFLEDDGLFVLLGYAVMLITAAVFTFLLTTTIHWTS